MAFDDVKLPLFHGNEIEDLEQYWFLCEAVWTIKHVRIIVPFRSSSNESNNIDAEKYE